MHPVHLNDHSTTYYDPERAQFSAIALDNMLMLHFPTSYNEVPQLQLQPTVGDHAHAWHGTHPQGFDGVDSSSHTMLNMPYTNGGMSASSGYETQFVSNPQPPVFYADYWPVNGGYHIAPGHDSQYNSPLAMSVHPVVSQTPTVYHNIPDTHPLAFASAALPPSSQMNTALTMLDMVGVGGQDVDVNTTTPAIYLYPTAMPLPAPVSGTSTPASPLSDSESTSNTTSPPFVRCMVDNCDQDIAVDKAILHQHLTSAHGYPALHRSRSVLCRWSGCVCTRPSSCRSLNLGAGHGVHIEGITDHIWTAHLNFQDVCGKCGDARWVHGFSLQRHMNTCGGRKQARCKGCRQMFRSTVALAGHIELGQCVGIVVV
jgi:hypothetical protein